MIAENLFHLLSGFFLLMFMGDLITLTAVYYQDTTVGSRPHWLCSWLTTFQAELLLKCCLAVVFSLFVLWELLEGEVYGACLVLGMLNMGYVLALATAEIEFPD